MPDTNKIVAAILTAGRLPTFSNSEAPRPMDDWLAEYNAWVEALETQDKLARKAASDASARNMVEAMKG